MPPNDDWFICRNASETVKQRLTFAFDTSSPCPRSCSQICRNVLLPCGCPVWSSRPIMVNVTLKTCSTRGLAHFSSSSLSSRTVNSSTVGASCGCLPADAGSLLAGCSENVSSVTRRIPSRGRVVDIPPLGVTVPADHDDSEFRLLRAAVSFRLHRGVRRCVFTNLARTFTVSNDINTEAGRRSRKLRVTYPESPSDGVINTRQSELGVQ